MLIIPIKEGENIDRALKRYKRKFDKTGTKAFNYKHVKQFTKPSVAQELKFKSAVHSRLKRRKRISKS